MVSLEKPLQEITGMSEKETQIYLALINLGEGTVIQIAKKSGLKRTTVYNLLPDLIKKGLILSTVNKKTRIYFVEDVRTLQQKLEEKSEQLKRILPSLLSMHTIFPFQPKITFYEGFEGMKELYMDTIKTCNAGDEIVSFMGMKNLYQMFTREFASYYIGERIKKKISLRMIAPEGTEASEALMTGKKQLRVTKIIKDVSFGFQGDMEIYHNKVAIVSYPENFIGVIIESQQVSDMMRAAFEIMWNSLK